jgi:hypothetical protein
MTTTNGTKPALPEAPASATLKATLRGYEVLFTLRDHSGRELLAKLGAAIDALEAMGAQPAASRGSAGVPNGSVPICPYHGPMKPSKFGGYHCTAKMGDGSYCKERAT